MATESRKVGGMTTALEIFWQQIDMARQNGDDTDLILRRYFRAKSKEPKKRPKMPPFNMPREGFMQLRNRHLDVVRDYGAADTYNRDELGKHFLTNYHKLFGPLRRSKAKEVPSDELRKIFMIGSLLDLIELRREENAAGAWRTSFPTNKF
jgi:hypothetical protein